MKLRRWCLLWTRADGERYEGARFFFRGNAEFSAARLSDEWAKRPVRVIHPTTPMSVVAARRVSHPDKIPAGQPWAHVFFYDENPRRIENCPACGSFVDAKS